MIKENEKEDKEEKKARAAQDDLAQKIKATAVKSKSKVDDDLASQESEDVEESGDESQSEDDEAGESEMEVEQDSDNDSGEESMASL